MAHGAARIFSNCEGGERGGLLVITRNLPVRAPSTWSCARLMLSVALGRGRRLTAGEVCDISPPRLLGRTAPIYYVASGRRTFIWPMHNATA